MQLSVLNLKSSVCLKNLNRAINKICRPSSKELTQGAEAHHIRWPTSEEPREDTAQRGFKNGLCCLTAQGASLLSKA